MKTNITDIQRILNKKYGNLLWWPVDKKYHKKNKSDPRFEIIVGAILTQNTAWSNVEKALDNLKSKNILDIKNINDIDICKLKDLIRPSGFFNQKAKRLKDVAFYLKNNYKCNLDLFLNKDKKVIRNELLSLNGIGPETADSIILYAAKKPVFVVDAYTKRLCKRIPIDIEITYENIQTYFEDVLSKTYKNEKLTQLFNEFHAQIVYLAKDFCKKKPICENCPLNKICNFNK